MSVASEINGRLAAGTATVLTLEQLFHRAHDGNLAGNVDLVAFAFPADISGSAVMFCVPVAGRGIFTRAEAIFVNGLRGHPGPAPNERLGVVDALVFADERSPNTGAAYDGAALFLDLLRGRSVEVECHSVEGTTHRNSFKLGDVEFARLYVYNAPLPSGTTALSVLPAALVPGARVVLNGAQGIVVGPGTRNRPSAMTLSLTADVHDMDPRLMTSADGRPRHVVAFALPVRGAAAITELLAWAGSAAGEALLCPSARVAAEGLQRMLRDGRYVLSETGAMDATEGGQ